MIRVEAAYGEVGTVLAELMEKERLSGARLAKLAGVSHATPHTILKGKARPTPTMLMRLARGLATSNSGVLDHEKETQYATELLRPLGFAPHIENGRLVAAVGDRVYGHEDD